MSSRKYLDVDLALQGGGARGAFTWGVLDRLLEEGWLRIEGISGTSAGAMNAAVLVHGYTENGPLGAKKALAQFWERIAQAALISPLQRTPLDVLLGPWTLDYSPTFIATDIFSKVVSPYFINPMGINPLHTILTECIDFSNIEKSPIKLFITATNVRTGRGRVFRNKELNETILLASACLPNLFQAVEIDGDVYWDGGYSGNPAITPLVRECNSKDTILVQINPIERPGTPFLAKDIQNRLNEVSFNAVLLKELRMMALLKKNSNPSDEEGYRWANMRIHRISSDIMIELGYSSKLNAEWSFLTMLRDKGREAADFFLKEYGQDLGNRSTLNFDELLEGI